MSMSMCEPSVPIYTGFRKRGGVRPKEVSPIITKDRGREPGHPLFVVPRVPSSGGTNPWYLPPSAVRDGWLA